VQAVRGVIRREGIGSTSSVESLAQDDRSSPVLGMLPSSNLPTPNSSCSSSSSTRSSLKMLPVVRLLAEDPARFRPLYRDLHAAPIPTPFEEQMEEVDLRASERYSMALSSALASRMTFLFSSSSVIGKESSSSIRLRRPHSSSSSTMFDEPSDDAGDVLLLKVRS